jgi:predicted TIM-barrel fold metal-dependent hydrolase
MIIDVHVHVSALTPRHGSMSQRLLKSAAFRFMRWRLGIRGQTPETEERALERKLVRTIEENTKIDAAAVLAFDAVFDRDGRFDDANTHLYVKNDYVIELAKKHRKILFAASVHPYRKDAVAEIERCANAGAVLMKWLPIVQNFNPADPRCIPFYEAMAHFKIPLLSHTGGEKSLPNLNKNVADPALLVPALQRGVTVIMAHCGTRSAIAETDYVETFMRLAREYEQCYGDTSALSLPTRWHAYRMTLADPIVRQKLVHGSDWPIPALPPFLQLGFTHSMTAMRERSWMRRDVMIKEMLGFDDAYWHRASRIPRLPDSPRRHEGKQ